MKRTVAVLAVVAALLLVVAGAQSSHDPIHAACLQKLSQIDSRYHGGGSWRQRAERMHTELHAPSLCYTEPPPPPPAPPPPMPLGTDLPTLIYNPLAPPTPVRTFYADWDTGDNSRSVSEAQSEGSPWKTPEPFIAIAEPGDHLLIKNRSGQTSTGGDSSVGYEPQDMEFLIDSVSGTAANPIVIRAYPGHKPVIRPRPGSTPGSVIGRVFHLTGTASYWAFVGLDMYHSSGTGGNEPVFWAGGSSHHIAVVGGDIHGATDGSGVFTSQTTTDLQFINVEVYENDDWRGTAQQSHGIYSQADRTLVANCICRDHANGFGIQIRTDGAAGPTDGWLVNNTLVRNNTSGSGIVKESGAVNVVAYNNIGYDNDNYAVRGFTAGPANGSGNKARKNIGHLNVGNPDFANQNSNSYGFDWSSDGSGNYGTPPGDNLDATDPLFVAPGSNDFRLQVGSPAIGYGLETFCPTFDHDGNTRSQVDAGAIRYLAALGPGGPQPAFGRNRLDRRRRGEQRVLVTGRR